MGLPAVFDCLPPLGEGVIRPLGLMTDEGMHILFKWQ